MITSFRSGVAGLLVAAGAAALVSGCTGESTPDPQVVALIEKLETGDIEERTEAATALAKLGPAARAAVPALVKNLGSGGGDRQMLNIDATNALLRIGPGAALPALIEALESDDPEIVAGAAMTIGGFGRAARPAIPALMKALEKPQVREAAAMSLRMIQEG